MRSLPVMVLVGVLVFACESKVSPTHFDWDEDPSTTPNKEGPELPPSWDYERLLHADIVGDFTCRPDDRPRASSVRRLSQTQYRAALRAVLGGLTNQEATAALDEALADGLPDDVRGTFLREDNTLEATHVRAFYGVAGKLSKHLTSNTPRLQRFVSHHVALEPGGCTTFSLTAPSAGCLDAFISSFGQRVLRRPLTTDEVALYRQTHAGRPTVALGLAAVIFRMVMSPQFLFFIEDQGRRVADTSTVELTDHELAARLSFHFLNRPPDAWLSALAQTGTLRDPTVYREAVARLLADPGTDKVFEEFYSGWLGLDHVASFTATEHPAFRHLARGVRYDDALRSEMIAELLELTGHITWKSQGSLADLMTTDVSFARGPELMKVYGVTTPAPTSIDASNAVRLPRHERAGVLTRPALLVSGTAFENPIHRSVEVLTNFLCLQPPSPDAANLPPGSLLPPPDDATLTTRERYEAKTSRELCVGCHRTINAVGFGLNNFDALGRYRTHEAIFDPDGGYIRDLQVSAAVDLGPLLGQPTPSSTPREYSEQLSKSIALQRCFAQKYYAFAFGRAPEPTLDGCALKGLRLRLGNERADLREFLGAVALTAAFQQRAVAF